MSNALVPEPSISEVLAKLHLMDIETRTRDVEIKSSVAEVRSSLSDVRSSVSDVRSSVSDVKSSVAELRLDMDIRYGDIFRRLDSLFAELVAFRTEYNQHTHDG